MAIYEKGRLEINKENVMITMIAFLLLGLQGSQPPALDLDDLVAAVLARNRDVLATRREWEAAQARPSQESAPPNPTIWLNSVNAGLYPLPGKSLGKEPLANVSPMFMQE